MVILQKNPAASLSVFHLQNKIAMLSLIYKSKMVALTPFNGGDPARGDFLEQNL